ncbi:SbcC/MukB-like Walker B domain-containing protein [Virgibacillus kimchii]
MKPITLTMTAFGPYKDKETIDFNNLDGHSLFVISGNTGAGKTTIFDGICFALYGTASGQDRENNTMLRSDFAADDVNTSVELIFELKGRTYRVLRQLGHVKQGNKTKTGERYEFFEITRDGEVPCVDRQMVSEIDKKVEELIGLTKDQFKQIVMLPQGEFRKLLTSKTENKEEILRRLFKTEPYKQITERLREKKNAADDAFNQAAQMKDNFIREIKNTLPERENSIIYQVLSGEFHNVRQITDGLTEEVAFYEKEMEQDQQSYQKAYKEHDDKQKEYHQAVALNEQFDDLEKKEFHLNQLNEQVPVFNEKEKQLTAAEQAGLILPYEKQLDDWVQDEKQKQTDLEQAKQAMKSAEEKLGKVQQRYVQEEAKQNERENVSNTLDRLQSFLPVVEEIDELKKELNELITKGKKANQQLDKADVELKRKTEETEQFDAEVKKMDALVGELPDKQEKFERIREQKRIFKEYIDLTRQQNSLEKKLQTSKTQAEETKAAYAKLESSWLANQAVVLASHLHDGEACPVCGSHDHPNKAVHQEESVSKEQLESLKKELDEKDTTYRETLAKYNEIQRQLQKAEQEAAGYAVSPEKWEETYKEVLQEERALETEVNRLKNMRQQLHSLKKKYEQEREALKQFEKTREEYREKRDQLRTKYKEKQGEYKGKVQPVPEEMRELTALKNEINKTEKWKEELGKAWEQIQQELEQVKDQHRKCEVNLDHAFKQMKESAEKKEKAAQQFEEAWKGHDFASREAYEQAKMNEQEQQKVKKEIESFKEERAALVRHVEEMKTNLQDKRRMDVTALAAQLKQLKDAYEAALEKWNRSERYYKDASKLKKNIADAEEAVMEKEEALRTITDLYDVIRGQNHQKISFERYLQIDYLEQIIAAANQRLKRLSNGQFYLMRSDRQESHGRQSGLALDVYDAYTGQTRDVKTLSGGEKFNASLCLALGMSDVIQSFQGSISIETMFIDEGFGTLDEESLNKAIDTLVELQQSGRMIGVISHVQELKTVFPAVLEVQKQKSGSSTTRFITK